MLENIRLSGLLKTVIGIIGATAAGFFIAWIRKQGYELGWGGWIIFGAPGAYGASGLLELITGVPFFELSEKWDDLAGWQRGLLGLVVVILCFGLLIGGMTLWAYFYDYA